MRRKIRDTDSSQIPRLLETKRLKPKITNENMPTLPFKVLNIAAGFLPLVATDFNVQKLVNFDPLKKADELGGILAGILSEHDDIIYRNRQPDVDSDYPNGSVDLIIGISPYGFSLIDTWADQKLKPGGYVLVLASDANKFLKDKNLFASTDLKSNYADVEHPFPYVVDIQKKIKENYPSHTSNLENSTPLDKSRILKKTPV